MERGKENRNGLKSMVAELSVLSGMFDKLTNAPTWKGKRPCGVNPTNPHNFPYFEESDHSFSSYSINQVSHDAKYAKWLKKNPITQPNSLSSI